jgi:ABC-2 type transport system permease protein
MTAILTRDPAATTAASDVHVSQLRVIHSEWTKFRSVRSTLYTLGVAVVLAIGLGALFSGVIASQWDTFSPADRASFNPIEVSLNGSTFAQLAIGVLGVLLITGEYSTGMIRSSLTAVPKRLPMLWGKLSVFAGVVFVVSLATAFVAFFLGQALLSSADLNVSISSPGALRSVFGVAVYLTLAGLMGVAIGALLRNTAAGISTFVGLFFVFPPLTLLLPSSWTSKFVQYLPSNAGEAMYGATRRVDDALSPGAGFLVLALWTAALIGAAAWRMRRVDA